MTHEARTQKNAPIPDLTVTLVKAATKANENAMSWIVRPCSNDVHKWMSNTGIHDSKKQRGVNMFDT